MEYEKIVELLREVNGSDLTEFELEDRDFHLKMKKESKTSGNEVKTMEDISPEVPADEKRPLKDAERRRSM